MQLRLKNLRKEQQALDNLKENQADTLQHLRQAQKWLGCRSVG